MSVGGIELAPLLVKLKVDLAEFESNMKNATDLATAKAEEVSSKLSGVTKIGEKLGDVGSALTKGLTVPLVGVGTAATKFAVDFDNSFAQLSTLLDKGSTDFDAYKKDVIKASSETGIAVDEYAESVYNAMSSGIDQAEAIEFTNEAMKLAKGGFTSGAMAVDILTTALNGYKLSAVETTKISDMLIKTQDLGKTTVDELASSMGTVIPIASSLNFGIDELSTGYAVLTKNGIATSEAGTYMKSMLSELGKTGSTTDKALRELTGKSFAELKSEGVATSDILRMMSGYAEENGLTLKDMFGSVEAGSAALVLASQNGAEYEEILKEMQNSAGSTNLAFETMNNTTGAKLSKAFNSLKNSMIQFGDVITPVIEKVAGFIGKVSEKLSGLSDEQVRLVIGVGLVVASIGPLLVGVAKAIEVFKTLKTAWVAVQAFAGTLGTSIGALALPIAGIVAGVIALYLAWKNNFGGLRDVTIEIFDSIKEIITTVWDFIKGIWDNNFLHIQDVCRLSWENIQLIFNTVFETIGGLIKAFSQMLQGDWEGAWQTLKETAQTVWENIEQIFKNMFEGIALVVGDIINSIIEAWENFWEGIKNKASEWLTNITEAIGLDFQGIVDVISVTFSLVVKSLSDIWQSIKDLFSGFGEAIGILCKGDWQGFKDTISQSWEECKENISVTWDKIKVTFSQAGENIKNKITESWTTIKENTKNFLEQKAENIKTKYGEMKENISNTWTNIKSGIKEKLDGIKNDTIRNFKDKKTTVEDSENKLKTGLSTLWNGIKSDTGRRIDEMKSNASNKFRAMKDDTINKFNDQRTRVVSAVTGLKNSAVSLFENMRSNIYSKVSNINSNVYTWFNQAKNNAISIFNNMKSGLSNVWNNITSWFTNAVKGLPRILTNVGSSLYNAGRNALDRVWDGMAGIWSSISSWVSSKVSWLVNKLAFWRSGSNEVNGYHYNGLNYVPFDGYTAVLHKGERVLTAKENQEYIQGGKAGSNGKGITIKIESFVNNTAQDIEQIANELSFYMQRKGVI